MSHSSAVQLKCGSSAPDAPTKGILAPPSRSTRERIALRIGGMTCAHCPPAIEQAIKSVDGVTSALVNSTSKIATIDYDPTRARVTDFLQAIRSRGYTVGTATTRIPIENMHCSSCIIRVELALQMTPGVVAARASLGPNAVDIEYQPERTDFRHIRASIESAGYKVAEHHIDGSWNQVWTGTTQIRNVKKDGDRLICTTQPGPSPIDGSMGFATVVWEKVK